MRRSLSGYREVHAVRIYMINNTRTDPPVTAVPVQLTEKIQVLAMYGRARRMHAVHASPIR